MHFQGIEHLQQAERDWTYMSSYFVDTDTQCLKHTTALLPVVLFTCLEQTGVTLALIAAMSDTLSTDVNAAVDNTQM